MRNWSFRIDQQRWPPHYRERSGHTEDRRTQQQQQWTLGANWPSNMAEGMLGAFVEVISGSGFLDGAGCPCIVFRFLQGGDSSAKKKKKSSLWPPPPSSPPHCLGGIGCQPPFVYLPSPAFPLAAQFLLFTAFCMKVAICEDYPAWGQHRVRKKKRNSKEDTVAWVLILTQGTSEDMGSVSNQEFPGGVTKNKMKLTFRFFLFIKLSCEGVSIWLQGSIYLFF